MRTIQDDFREFAELDRRRTGDGVRPDEFRRWLQLRERLDRAFSSRPPTGQKERRGSLRVPTRLLVSSRAGRLEGTVRDFSRTGCFIQSDLTAPVGTRLELVLHASGTCAPFEIPAKVVTANVRLDGRITNERGMGVRFVDVPPETQKRIDELYAGLDAG